MLKKTVLALALCLLQLVSSAPLAQEPLPGNALDASAPQASEPAPAGSLSPQSLDGKLAPGLAGPPPPPPYQFAFEVKDDAMTNYHNRVEMYNNGVLQGSYSLLSPDGVVRTSIYSDDGVSGFQVTMHELQTNIGIRGSGLPNDPLVVAAQRAAAAAAASQAATQANSETVSTSGQSEGSSKSIVQLESNTIEEKGTVNDDTLSNDLLAEVTRIGNVPVLSLDESFVNKMIAESDAVDDKSPIELIKEMGPVMLMKSIKKAMAERDDIGETNAEEQQTLNTADDAGHSGVGLFDDVAEREVGTVDDGGQSEVIAIDDGGQSEVIAIDDGEQSEVIAIDDGGQSGAGTIDDGGQSEVSALGDGGQEDAGIVDDAGQTDAGANDDAGVNDAGAFDDAGLSGAGSDDTAGKVELQILDDKAVTITLLPEDNRTEQIFLRVKTAPLGGTDSAIEKITGVQDDTTGIIDDATAGDETEQSVGRGDIAKIAQDSGISLGLLRGIEVAQSENIRRKTPEEKPTQEAVAQIQPEQNEQESSIQEAVFFVQEPANIEARQDIEAEAGELQETAPQAESEVNEHEAANGETIAQVEAGEGNTELLDLEAAGSGIGIALIPAESGTMILGENVLHLTKEGTAQEEIVTSFATGESETHEKMVAPIIAMLQASARRRS